MAKTKDISGNPAYYSATQVFLTRRLNFISYRIYASHIPARVFPRVTTVVNARKNRTYEQRALREQHCFPIFPVRRRFSSARFRLPLPASPIFSSLNSRNRWKVRAHVGRRGNFSSRRACNNDYRVIPRFVRTKRFTQTYARARLYYSYTWASTRCNIT